MIVEGTVFPLDRADVDTDQIVPAKYLTGLGTSGYGPLALAGVPGIAALDAAHPDATILVARANFGCGSSREHAAWALRERGFRAIVAPSFARIFLENAYTNGIVPVVVDDATVTVALGARAARVDVERERLQLDDGPQIAFTLDPLRKQFVLGGGYLAFLASRIERVRAWEAGRRP